MSELNQELQGKKIGIVITGSFCTIEKIMVVLKSLKAAGAQVTAILSYNVDELDTRFGTAKGWKDELEALGAEKIMASIAEAEPIGPKQYFDVLVVAPCTGNTLAKLALGITDTPALMAVKSHLRNSKPVVIAISTNDGLSNNAKNLGQVLNYKNIYWVPFGQDNPWEKANSLVADMDKIAETIVYALNGKQIQPILLQYAPIVV